MERGAGRGRPQRRSGEMLGCVGVSFEDWGRTTKAAAAAALYCQLIIVIYFAAADF